MTTAHATRNHPAPYSPTIIDSFAEHLWDEHERLQADSPKEFAAPHRVLDPFAGVGRIHEIQDRTGGIWETTGIELEPEWACAHPRTIVGDATALPFDDRSFDAVAVSPTYGNRMADKYDGKGKCRNCSGEGGECERCEGTGIDQSTRRTYRIWLGRMPSTNSTSVAQWGSQYRALHRAAWEEAVRVLKPSGLFLLNCKDHQRKGERQYVTDWHIECLVDLGLHVVSRKPVETPGFRHGQNHEARFDEEIVALRRHRC